MINNPLMLFFINNNMCTEFPIPAAIHFAWASPTLNSALWRNYTV